MISLSYQIICVYIYTRTVFRTLATLLLSDRNYKNPTGFFVYIMYILYTSHVFCCQAKRQHRHQRINKTPWNHCFSGGLQERLSELTPDVDRLSQEITAAEEVQRELVQQLKQNKAINWKCHVIGLIMFDEG